ncbi:MAG: hypothetical protein N3B12_09350, partial [Armatimonadetes bacterium]|nr:hypothetical protein [Armatimonadota bacterium]
MRFLLALLAAVQISIVSVAVADTLELKDGTVMQNCYVRDEGVELVVWKKLADVGTPNYVVYPRSKVKRF